MVIGDGTSDDAAGSGNGSSCADFVNVRSVAVYCAGNAFTVDTPLGVPRHTKLQRLLMLDDFLQNLPSAERLALTLDMAARRNVNFGLAAHYATSAGAATVYREEQFSELQLVRQSPRRRFPQ